MLVVGEGRHPVNVSSGSGSGGSSAGTALVPVNHHTARSEWPQQILLSLPGVTRAKLSEFDVNLQKMLVRLHILARYVITVPVYIVCDIYMHNRHIYWSLIFVNYNIYYTI